jgi:hypothetical protein
MLAHRSSALERQSAVAETTDSLFQEDENSWKTDHLRRPGVPCQPYRRGVFLPVYGIFEGGPYNCLKDGIAVCIAGIPLSALIYGPLFSIAGVLIGTPVFMAIFAMRD